MIEVYIGNQGKYGEGILDVKPLNLPATTETLQTLLFHIGVDGKRYEEIYIADCLTNVSGLVNYMSRYDSIDELNYLAALLEGLDRQGEIPKFEAALTLGEHTGSTGELINLIQNLDCYNLYPEVKNEEDLGRYCVDEFGILDIPDGLEPYFNYEAYGRDIFLSETSEFTDRGYICNNSSQFVEHYVGKEDLPKEYRIFAYPKEKEAVHSILETLKQFKDTTPDAVDSREKPAASHNER